VGLLVLLVPGLMSFHFEGVESVDRDDHNTGFGFDPHYTQEKFKLTKKLFPGMLNGATGNFASFPIFQTLEELTIKGLTVDPIWLRLPHLQTLTLDGEIQVPHIPEYIKQLGITALTVQSCAKSIRTRELGPPRQHVYPKLYEAVNIAILH
jgi:hypothetical protein